MQLTKKLWILAAVLTMAGTAFAQAEKESATGFYHLEFVTKELDENKRKRSEKSRVIKFIAE